MQLITHFINPRKDERLSWFGWSTYSRRLTHIIGHQSAAGQAQNRESSLAEDGSSTTVPCNQPCQRTEPNQGTSPTGLILSSSTAGLLKEGQCSLHADSLMPVNLPYDKKHPPFNSCSSVKIDSARILCPNRQKIDHFGDVLPSLLAELTENENKHNKSKHASVIKYTTT